LGSNEGFEMGANQSNGGVASTRAEEEVHAYESFGMGVMFSIGAEEDVVSNEGFANQVWCR
jgi:hypothetical protein